MSHQKLILIGYLGAEPEMRFTPSGQSVANFSLATNRQYTGKDGETVKETIWFRISAWGKLAEICNQHLHKGSQVYIEGRLNADPATGGSRLWTRQDGSPAASFEATAETIRFLGGKNGGNGLHEHAPAATAAGEADSLDIPF